LIVTLDRPKANAIDAHTSHLLYEAFLTLKAEPDLRVGVVTGAGSRFFSAGWDLKAAVAGEPVDADWGPGGFAGLTEFFEIDKPVVAAVNGLAFGGGLELALAADCIVMADHAELALPEATLGLLADSGGILRLRDRLPRAIAVEMILTGRRMGAAEAERWGLVNQIVESAILLESAIDLAQRIADSAPLPVLASLELLRETEGKSVREGFEIMRGGLHFYDQVSASADAQEGPRAFVEQRKPNWKGSYLRMMFRFKFRKRGSLC
jgi:crotonobetainyl-CoA hydratase